MDDITAMIQLMSIYGVDTTLRMKSLYRLTGLAKWPRGRWEQESDGTQPHS